MADQTKKPRNVSRGGRPPAKRPGGARSRLSSQGQISEGVDLDESFVGSIEIIDNVPSRVLQALPEFSDDPEEPDDEVDDDEASPQPAAPVPARSYRTPEEIPLPSRPARTSSPPQGPPPGMPRPTGHPSAAPPGVPRPTGHPSAAPSGVPHPTGHPSAAPSGIPRPTGHPSGPPPGMRPPAGRPSGPPPGMQPPAGHPSGPPPAEPVPTSRPAAPPPEMQRSSGHPSAPAQPVQRAPSASPPAPLQPPEGETILTPSGHPAPRVRPSQAPGPGRVGVYTIPIKEESLDGRDATASAPPPEPRPRLSTPSGMPSDSPHSQPRASVTETTGRPRPSAPAPSAPPPEPLAVDPRLAEIEAFLERGRWSDVVTALGSLDAARRLPPNLQVIYGIARRESAGDRETTTDTDMLAIQGMARLLGVSDQSPLATLVAKRTLRSRRPWSNQKASGSFSVILAILVLGLGALAGYLYTVFF